MVRNVLLVLVLLTAFAGPVPGRASPEGATIQVSTTTDDLIKNGNCTLREALRAANTDSAVDACPAGNGNDLILLPAGVYILTLPGTDEAAGLTGDLDIFSSLTLRGAGQGLTIIEAELVEAELDEHIVEIAPGSHRVKLEYLDLHHRMGISSRAELELLRVTVIGRGEGWGQGLGIYNAGKLRMESSTVRGMVGDNAIGAGVYNSGELTILDSVITDNYAETGSGPGIYNSGTAFIQNTNLDQNWQHHYTGEPGGNIYNSGVFHCENCSIKGGVAEQGKLIFNSGSMTLVDSQLAWGSSRRGLGSNVLTTGSLTLLRTLMFDSDRALEGSGSLTIIDSEFTNNRASAGDDYPFAGGGALRFSGTASISGTAFKNNEGGLYGGAIRGSGQWTIRDSVFSGNKAPQYGKDWDMDFEYGYGGAIFWEGGVLTATNTTISGNTASTGGGGIFVWAGEVRLNSVTLAENRTIDYSGGGGLSLVNGSAVLHNTLLARNHEYKHPDCYQFREDPISKEPAASQLTSLGYNLIGSLDGCEMSLAAGDQEGWEVYPILPLADNGGRTQTHALPPNSPALDQGDPAACPLTDQRGIPRPQGPRCDIGAFELEQEPAGLQVQIDIRPGSPLNKINPNSRASVPVAILSGPGFYAPEVVDLSSLTFGRSGTEDSLEWAGGGNRPGCQARDVNKDRQLDLVCRFNVAQMGFQPGDTLGRLRGQTLAGEPVSGEDSVTIRYPTSREQDDEDTRLDLHAYLGDALIWMPLVVSEK